MQELISKTLLYLKSCNVEEECWHAGIIKQKIDNVHWWADNIISCYKCFTRFCLKLKNLAFCLSLEQELTFALAEQNQNCDLAKIECTWNFTYICVPKITYRQTSADIQSQEFSMLMMNAQNACRQNSTPHCDICHECTLTCGLHYWTKKPTLWSQQ